MRKLALVLVATLLLGGIAYAGIVSNTGTIQDQIQIVKNGVQTQTAVISGNGEYITGFEIAAAGTAQTCGLFDTTTTGAIAVTNGVFEASVPANTTAWFDFTNAPIRTTTGVSLYCSRTDGFATVFTKQ